MLKISDVLKNIYIVDWSKQIVLECGANKYGDETMGLSNISNCWYVEPNPTDYENLKKIHKNTLNFALSDKNDYINFNVCEGSGSGLSGIHFTKQQLKDLSLFKIEYKTITVEAITYEKLIETIGSPIDVLVLDIEGHEINILKNFLTINYELLPKIIVIECGYDWEERVKLLSELNYEIDSYYYNNCYLTKKSYSCEKNSSMIKKFNEEWREFMWGDTIIYKNHL